MYNCPVVTVSKSTFENNHAQSVFRDLLFRVSGGGLSITIYDRNNSSVMKKTIRYTIQNCTFFNNSAKSTVPAAVTRSILQGGHVNGRGGGVTFYVVHPSVIKIKVLDCNFTNNSASAYGGGLYVFSPELVTKEDFTIADNHFEGNVAAVAGGGINLGATFQQTNEIEYLDKNVFTESVIFSQNIFVWNRAKCGGAMSLGPAAGKWVFHLQCKLPWCLEVWRMWQCVCIVYWCDEYVCKLCIRTYTTESAHKCPLIMLYSMYTFIKYSTHDRDSLPRLKWARREIFKHNPHGTICFMLTTEEGPIGA